MIGPVITSFGSHSCGYRRRIHYWIRLDIAEQERLGGTIT